MDTTSQKFSDSLKAFCLNHITRTEDFAKAEAEILDDLFNELALAFGKALETFDDILAAERVENWDIKDKRSRTVLTEFGETTFLRRSYIDQNGERRNYLDEVLDLSPRKRVSPGVCDALVGFSGEVSYARAAQTVFRHCNASITATTASDVLRNYEDDSSEAASIKWRENFSSKRKTVVGALIAAVVTLSLAGALVGPVQGFIPWTEFATPTESNIVEFPINDGGLTYGSLVDAESVGKLPDLILVTATNGETGYIHRTDYIASSRAANSRNQAEEIMHEYEQCAAEAFREYIFESTGYELSSDADVMLCEVIYRNEGIELDWGNLSEQQQSAVISLLPEDIQSPELVQGAYTAAISANDSYIPVYKLDGETIVGEIIIK